MMVSTSPESSCCGIWAKAYWAAGAGAAGAGPAETSVKAQITSKRSSGQVCGIDVPATAGRDEASAGM
jgi:hypothetical protein